MARAIHRVLASLLVMAALAGLAATEVRAQAPIEVSEIAEYRLTAATFERFEQASERIAGVTRQDRAFDYAPLFTRDVALSDDAVSSVAGLVARLEHHPGLVAALGVAMITPREYSICAITLVAAHVAHGFLRTGVLRRVPQGAPAANVAFVEAHEADVVSTLATLGIRD